jgi:glutamyl-tRNA synthetase
MKYNTRIAPSPTGDMHLGTARTAYFNWLAARSTGGKFILRIDDTDVDRNKPEYTQVILDTMDWLGLDYDSIEYQSKRFDRYKEVANDLIGKKYARIAYGSTDAVVLTPMDGNEISFNIPDSFQDELAGEVKITARDKELMVPSTDSNGIVLLRSDGLPTYHFACVVDDIDMGINYVIRGVDHLTNTARQVAIYTALGAEVPKFAHIGLISKDKRKLSKRDGAASMLHYRDAGYDPDALLNGMARLGWGPTVDDKTTALLPKEKMLELFFSGGKMKSSVANMEMHKLDSFDRKYKARKKV